MVFFLGKRSCFTVNLNDGRKCQTLVFIISTMTLLTLQCAVLWRWPLPWSQMQVHPSLCNIHMLSSVVTRKPSEHVRRRTALPGLSARSRAMLSTGELPWVRWAWVPPAPEQAARDPEGPSVAAGPDPASVCSLCCPGPGTALGAGGWCRMAHPGCTLSALQSRLKSQVNNLPSLPAARRNHADGRGGFFLPSHSSFCALHQPRQRLGWLGYVQVALGWVCALRMSQLLPCCPPAQQSPGGTSAAAWLHKLSSSSLVFHIPTSIKPHSLH